jgi:hypothetical protein
MNILNNINIPQREFVEHFYDIKVKYRKDRNTTQYLDIKDIVIYMFCRNFMLSTSKKIQRIQHDNETYTWIAVSYIIEQLPILRIKNKRSIIYRLRKLEYAGLLERIQDKVKHGKLDKDASFYKLGSRADCLHYSKHASQCMGSMNQNAYVNDKNQDNLNIKSSMHTDSDNIIVCNKDNITTTNDDYILEDVLEEDDPFFNEE